MVLSLKEPTQVLVSYINVYLLAVEIIYRTNLHLMVTLFSKFCLCVKFLILIGRVSRPLLQRTVMLKAYMFDTDKMVHGLHGKRLLLVFNQLI
ncbi:hypothetical protein DMQ72_25735 [Klebsiella quasipneumoniae]|nr:hypothetical protein DMQ72_25735 [Klebsiella quasipneumoniae]